MTQTPATPEDADMTLSELMEHRDLQNAQVGSMAHIWDNAADERWNDLPVPTDEADGTEQGTSRCGKSMLRLNSAKAR